MKAEFNKTQLVSLFSLGSPALVFGHSDADGYLAAEQTRRNLRKANVRVTDVVVSPATANYRFWTDSFSKMTFKGYSLVISVDIAFDFKNPRTSIAAVLGTCRRNPDTQFVIIDHHPLLMPKRHPQNLTLISVDRVYDCCLGEPSDEFMAVASICDGGLVVSPPHLRERHTNRAVGLKRAVADRNVEGEKLLSLLRKRKWSFFEALAQEPPESHRVVRGRRTAQSDRSPLLSALAD